LENKKRRQKNKLMIKKELSGEKRNRRESHERGLNGIRYIGAVGTRKGKLRKKAVTGNGGSKAFTGPSGRVVRGGREELWLGE